MSRHRRKTAAPLTVAGLVREGERKFRAARLHFGHGTFNARDEAAYLTLHALGLPLDASARLRRHTVSPDEARRVRELFSRRIRSRKPSPYLTNEAWLGNFRFYVDERAITPRSHIAGLLNDQLSPWIATPGSVRTALDLCTGSGCLAILLAHSFPQARIDAVDASAAALAVARINVRNYRLSKRIRLVKSDTFSALVGKRYDLIVCNPPYVTAAAMQRLPREYRHEPRMALAGGSDGLGLVRTILKRIPGHLAPGGLLVMEVGDGGRRVERAFPGIEFTWAETPGGGDVLVVHREQLQGPALPARAKRATA